MGLIQMWTQVMELMTEDIWPMVYRDDWTYNDRIHRSHNYRVHKDSDLAVILA